MKHRITAALERFSRAMLAPLSYLSAAGLLLVVGALLTSAPLAGVLPFLRWEPVQLAGRIIYKCLTAVISNLSVLFCTGLAAALAKREKHQAAFIALMSYLVYLTAGNVTLTELGLLAQPDALTGLYSAGQTMVLGIQTVNTGVFGGILLGLCALALNFGMLTTYDQVYMLEVPGLEFAKMLNPVMGGIYAAILIIMIYNTIVPMMISVANLFVKDEKDPVKYRAMLIALAVIFLIGGQFKFSVLINIIYPFVGYVGIIFMVVVLVQFLRWKCFGKKEPQE